MKEKKSDKTDVRRIHRYIDSLCGIYSRVARKLGLDRSYVSRVARGQRQSKEVEAALVQEFEQMKGGEA
jgi:DNA invertase Pin-like site-specific DNA recombinase